MSRKITLIFSASLFFTAACGNVATPTNTVAIQPRDCKMLVNQTLPFTLDGSIPPNSVVNWEANAGGISFASPGLNALFTAPSQPAVVTISVTISSGTPSVQIPVTVQCIVTDDSNPSVVPPTPPLMSTQPTVIISEVMGNPCGDIKFKKWNEYVELYNYGDQPVDVGGWWLADNGGDGSPDQLVAWSQRNPTRQLASNLIVNTTTIPPKGIALILSPSYTDGEFPYPMPYVIPTNTVILTAAQSRSIGDDAASIVGDGQGRDVLVLYIGGSTIIQETISTYGTPKPTQYVADIGDDYLDNLPLDLHECASIERRIPTGADSEENWREVPNGSPGEFPY